MPGKKNNKTKQKKNNKKKRKKKEECYGKIIGETFTVRFYKLSGVNLFSGGGKISLFMHCLP